MLEIEVLDWEEYLPNLKTNSWNPKLLDMNYNL